MAKGGFIVASAKKKKSHVMDFRFSKVWLIKINMLNFHLFLQWREEIKISMSDKYLNSHGGPRGVKTLVRWCRPSSVFIKRIYLYKPYLNSVLRRERWGLHENYENFSSHPHHKNEWWKTCTDQNLLKYPTCSIHHVGPLCSPVIKVPGNKDCFSPIAHHDN